MKIDEAVLWEALTKTQRSPRDLGRELQMHPKRVVRTCEKWAGQGVYDYGVSPDLGWQTREGAPA